MIKKVQSQTNEILSLTSAECSPANLQL